MLTTSVHPVYLYDRVYPLLAIGDTFCASQDNGPMVNTLPLKCHKDLDNTLIFRALTPDRTPFDIACSDQVYGRIIDPDNRKIVLEKLCTLGPAKGIIKLELDAGDIALIAPGLYNLTLIRTQEFVSNVPGYYVQKPLYSDFNNNVLLELEITEQALKSPNDSITILPIDWTPDAIIGTMSPPQICFYSSRIPGARVQNHIDSVHSFSTYTKNFTGRLELWASLEESPDPYLNDSRWFKIYPSTMSQDIEYTGYQGTTAFSFQANVMWLKFRLIPSTAVLDPGSMEKILIRM